MNRRALPPTVHRSRRRLRFTVAAAIVAAASVPGGGSHAAPAGRMVTAPVVTPLPAVRGPLATTATSHPWNAAAHGLTPIDLSARRYVEQEFLLDGRANVYSESPSGGLTYHASGAYETRLLVRRPSNPSRFSGNVVLELINPTSNYDVDIMWAAGHDHFMRRGDVYVGISIKPVVLDSMKAFDPSRYGGLSMANPAPEQTCAEGSAETETGLAWDMISQAGALLRSTSNANPLARFRVQHEYLTGYSQSGGYMVTYINNVAPYFVQANGSPIFDGYLIGAGYGFTWLAPVNQCAPPAVPGTPAAPSVPGVPQFVVHPPGDAPVIDVQTLSDSYSFFGWAGERPDGDAPGDRYRLYQVAGSSHIWASQVAYTPGSDDLVRAGFPGNDWQDNCLAPLNPFPLEYQLNAAFDNLDRWVRTGVPAPRAEHMTAIGDGTPAATILTDEHGNALGGVRSPAVDVPTATYYGTTPGGGTCLLLWGSYAPFDEAKLQRLYPTHDAYVRQVTADANALLAGRWLTPEDAAAITSAAEAAPVP